MTRQPAPQQHKLKHFEEAVLPCWLCPVMQGRASQIDCAVTERYRAVTFRPEFAVLVEFCAADKFHYTRAADTVNTVKILSLFHFIAKLLHFSCQNVSVSVYNTVTLFIFLVKFSGAPSFFGAPKILA